MLALRANNVNAAYKDQGVITPWLSDEMPDYSEY